MIFAFYSQQSGLVGRDNYVRQWSYDMCDLLSVPLAAFAYVTCSRALIPFRHLFGRVQLPVCRIQSLPASLRRINFHREQQCLSRPFTGWRRPLGGDGRAWLSCLLVGRHLHLPQPWLCNSQTPIYLAGLHRRIRQPGLFPPEDILC